MTEQERIEKEALAFASREFIADRTDKLIEGYIAGAKAELKRKDETIKQLKEALKVCINDLMYTSTTGHLWMWACSNGKVPERLLNARKLIEDELNT